MEAFYLLQELECLVARGVRDGNEEVEKMHRMKRRKEEGEEVNR